MSCALIAAVLLCAQEAPGKQVYRDPGLGLSFEMPKAWTLKKDRVGSTVEIPLGDGPIAEVQIFNAVFRQTAEEWQSVQKEVSEAMGRTVERQWQEEFLGVPMLFTRLRYSDEGTRVVSLVGLLYSRTNEKFQFRLVAPVEQAEAAEAQWREALLTLRTDSGELPKGEDPTEPAATIQPPKPAVVFKPESKKPVDPFVGPVRVRVGDVADPFDIFLPAEWSLAEDGKLAHPRLAGSITMTARGGTAPEALRDLAARAAAGLGEFESVELRKDTAPSYNLAGIEVATVSRRGKKDGADLNTMTAIGYGELVYWVVTYRLAGSPQTQVERALVQELLQGALVRRAQ